MDLCGVGRDELAVCGSRGFEWRVGATLVAQYVAIDARLEVLSLDASMYEILRGLEINVFNTSLIN